ncbi:hypothetical protein AGOR_G00072220 [Albula goreensis]|uniref:Ig-like domain-containing protein n=1 Tax=Albula goreensis TaxID=1534307 RepID=A0A8T3DSR1_9TELE|nr:hypothetical protein AGOR_G00072220 [Albula goreensis]
MNKLCGCIVLSWLCIYQLPSSESFKTVYGYVGQSVTLPCRYDAQYHGPLHVCWGRGNIPSHGCSNLIISTDGNKVTDRKSSRYQLLGRLNMGDVSLTIHNTVGTDAGVYGCRVEVPGWFNDEKNEILLILETAPTTQITVTTQQETSNSPTQAHATTTTQVPLTTHKETTDISTPAPTTQIPVITQQETTNSPSQAHATTTQVPLTTHKETTDNTGDRSYSTPTPTPVTQNDKTEETEMVTEKTPIEEAVMHSSPLFWILGLIMLLVTVFVTALVFGHIRRKMKAGNLNISQKTSHCVIPATCEPSLELETRKIAMENTAQMDEGGLCTIRVGHTEWFFPGSSQASCFLIEKEEGESGC